MFSIHEILDLAIRLEKNGESVYRNAAAKLSGPDLVSLLVWMADEEVKHARWFSELKHKLETDSINPFMEEMGREIFTDMLGEKSFSHRDVDFSKMDEPHDLIAVFIEFEQDTVLFYETLKPFIEDNDTLNNLEKIIAEENNHIAQLHKFLTNEAEVIGSSHVAVLLGGGRLAVFDRDSDAIEVSITPSLSDPHWSSVALEDATPLFEIDLVDERSTELLQLAQLGMLARALGAAARGFEQATDYAKEREQFGQPIGRFQAVQHKLANSFIELAGVRLLLDGAAESHDAGESRWLPLAQAAHAFGSSALRQVALENHHVLGAIGYSDEHEATHQFRRIHSDTLCLGGPLQANAGLASYLLDQGCAMPDYDLGQAGNAKREEIRAWLKTSWDAAQGGSDSDARKLLGSNGLISFAWPTKFGGTGATPVEEMALLEAFEEAEIPETAYASPQIQAHAIMAYGSVEQQAEFLPKLASGEVQFCLGYSEPGSGSDLASLRTTAVLDGDEWVINGEKIWTTLAESADYMWLAARTDPEVKAPHAGISIFIVPMDSPGMTVRPSLALYGKTFCHEFLDDVRVPGDALVGELNGGWTVLTAALAVERSIMGGYVSKVRKKFSYLCKAVRDNPRLASNFQVRDRIGRMAAEIEVSRRLYVAALQIAEQGNVPIVEASVSGVFNSELMERLGEMALDILGPRAVLSKDSDGAVAGDLEQMLRQAIMMVVGGGTNEIQRNLIAQRGLGLPR